MPPQQGQFADAKSKSLLGSALSQSVYVRALALIGTAPTCQNYKVILPEAIFDAPGGWWLFLTVIQSPLSITLFALFLLAIRWRIRRE